MGTDCEDGAGATLSLAAVAIIEAFRALQGRLHAMLTSIIDSVRANVNGIILWQHFGLTELRVYLQGGYKYHQYQVVGRHLPTEKEPEPTVYRMKLWATDAVRAKSKFW